MATSLAYSSRRHSRVWTVVSALCCLVAGVGGWPAAAPGETIQATDFKIEIASNVGWINCKAPAAGLKLWRQTAMEQTVLGARPYMRVTNNSSGEIKSFQLNLSNREMTAIKGCLWTDAPAGSQWKWSNAADTAVFEFAKPIASGESFTIRVYSAARKGSESSFALLQNFFAPGQPIFGQSKEMATGLSGFGVLGLSVDNGLNLRASATAVGSPTSLDQSAIEQFHYNLDRVVIDPYKTAGQQIGITIGEVQPVPEPSAIVLLATAGLGCVGFMARRRRPAPCSR